MTFHRKLGDISLALLLAALLPPLGPSTVMAQPFNSMHSLVAQAAEAPPGPPGCLWPEISGSRLLDHRLGPISFKAATVWEVVHALIREHHVPLSFIETNPEAKLTIKLGEASVRQVLDAIVVQAPRYRYTFVSSRLVLYPHDSPWD